MRHYFQFCNFISFVFIFIQVRFDFYLNCLEVGFREFWQMIIHGGPEKMLSRSPTFDNIQPVFSRLRPYHVENTRSRPISEVKLRRAQLVLTWVTGWEY